MKPSIVLAAGWAALVLGPLALEARGEEIVLASGTRYDATDVALVPGERPGDGQVRFTFRAGGGRATLALPYERIEARSLFALALARADAQDATSHLDLARFALSRGLLPEATKHFRRAADLDPALADASADGLAAVRDADGLRLLARAEDDVRHGRSDRALATAREVGARAVAGSLLAERAASLADLAGRLVDRDRERREAEVQAKQKAAEAAASAAFDSTLLRADRALGGALDERGRAADPDASATEALRSLEAASARLREARRLLATLADVPEDRREAVEKRDGDALAWTIATYLDLADLFRQRARFDRARDHVRAAQVLDPENPRVAEVRALIEQDLHAPPVPYDDGWGYGFSYVNTWGTGILGGSCRRGGFVGGFCAPRCSFGHGCHGGGWGFVGRW